MTELPCLTSPTHVWRENPRGDLICRVCWVVLPTLSNTCRLKRGNARSPGIVSRRAWAAAAELGQEACAYCRQPWGTPTFDHHVPRAAGGTLKDGWSLCCRRCNTSRGTCPLQTWLAAIRYAVAWSEQHDLPLVRPTWSCNEQKLTWSVDTEMIWE